jgi:hypothetical protein
MGALSFQLGDYNNWNHYFVFFKSKQGTRVRKQNAGIQNIRAFLSVRFGHELTPNFQIYPWEGSDYSDMNDGIPAVDVTGSDTP